MKKQLARCLSCYANSHYILRYGLIVLIVSALLYLFIQYPAWAKSPAAEHTSPNMAQAQVAAPGRIIFALGGAGGYNGFDMINSDGTNRISLSDYGSGQVHNPSVSQQTGMIAFSAQSVKITPSTTDPYQGSRIFVMNGDGTGVHQLTFAPSPGNDAVFTSDSNPRISPDGTKVAFISKRTENQLHQCTSNRNSVSTRQEVWVVNVDGSNLRQLTFPRYVDVGIPNDPFYAGNRCGASSNFAVAWSADSQQLAVIGQRPYVFTKSDGANIYNSISIVNVDGASEQTIAYNFDDPADTNPNLEPEPVVKAKVGIGNFIDWSPSGTILFSADLDIHNFEDDNSLGFIAPGEKADYRTTQELMGLVGYGSTDGHPHGGRIDDACYSPDGSQILLKGISPIKNPDRPLSLFIGDGSHPLENSQPFIFGGNGIAWAAGPAIPTPDKLVLTPNPLLTYNGQTVQATPTLLDADGNVIVRAARWRTDGAGFRCDNTPDQIPCSGSGAEAVGIDFTGKVAGVNNEAQGNLCAVNAGIMGCTPYYNTSGKAFLSVAATKPIALTSGTGGPGVLTIKREGDPQNKETLVVNFSLSGTAQRDVDYSLDFSGNTVVIPADRNSVDINVRPLRDQTEDKTVIFTLQPDAQTNYAIASFSNSTATVTIKDDGVSNNLSLSAVTPNAGGDNGNVTATIYGANIQQGATVKLSRNGQADIAGSAGGVAANGFSITTTFNLAGRERGTWDVVVTNPNNQTATLPGTFTVEANKGAQLWVDVVGRYTFRSGLTERFYIAYGNRGDVDTEPTVIRVYIPAGLELQGLPTLIDGSVPAILPQEDGTVLEFYLKGIAAGSSSYLPINLTADPALAHQTVNIRAFAMSSPGLKQTVDVQPDPTVTFTSELIENTANHSKTVIHANSATGNFDIFDEVNIEDDTQTRPRTLNVVRDGDAVQYIYSMSVPTSSAGLTQALSAHSMREQGGYKKIAEVLTTRFTKEIDGGSVFHHITWVRVNRKLFAECLVKQGLIMTNGEFDKSLEEDFIPAEFTLTIARSVERRDNQPNVLTLNRTLDPVFDTHQSLFDYLYTGWQVNPNLPPEMRALLKIDKNKHPEVKAKLIEYLIRKCGCNNPDVGLLSHARAKLPATESMQAVALSCNCPSGKCQTAEKEDALKIAFAFDPNEKVGTQGVGGQHYITGEDPVNYSVFFENKPDATAPAQSVVITDQLDTSKLNISTFSLGAFSFGDTVVAVPPGLSDYTTDVDLRPAKNLIVRINAQLNKTTGLLTAQFTSLDAGTMQPVTDPLAGFLPPNVTSPEGQGSIIFSVQPKSSLATGDEIRNRARIVFDSNAPLDTPEWLNTIDRAKPQSQVAPLPATECGSFEVSWAGTDAGDGIEFYSIYVSEDGGPYVVWQLDTTDTHTTFNGLASKSYSFYSVARDGAGNTEEAPVSSDAMTTINAASLVITPPPDKTFYTGLDATSCGLLIENAALGTASVSGGCSTPTTNINGLPAGNVFPVGTTRITYKASDGSGNEATAEQKITVVDKTPPVISPVSVDKTELWPANHKMVDVIVRYKVTDNCDGASAVTRVLSVTSNEPVNGTGDGDTAPDWEVLNADRIRLRAERAGSGQGRTYTITITATDSKGNYSSRSVIVIVPKSK
jgi:hypothetical protein